MTTNQMVKSDPLDLSFPWASLTERGLVQKRKPTWDEFESTVAVLSRMDRATPWGLGDAVLLGDREFGEQAAQAYGCSSEAARQYAWVCERFPFVTRVTTLSFAHHRAVAGLDTPEERRHWLKKAEAEGWSEKELRKQLGLGAHVGHNSGNNEWYTPLEYIDAAREVLGEIDLDPASSAAANKVVKAKKFYSAVDNGLEKNWQGRVWMNPPYAQPLIEQFSTKLVEDVEIGAVKQACVLVNNATETGWFQKLLSVSSAVCFPKGRVKFWRTEGDDAVPLQGQAVLYVGDNIEQFTETFSEFGIVLQTGEVLAGELV